MINIKAELKRADKVLFKELKTSEEQRIERTNYDLEMMKEMGYCSG